MKSVLRTIVLLAIIISVSSEYSDKCVSESDGTTFKHPESNKLYLVCLSHETYEAYCLDNHYYNEKNQVCVLSNEIIDVTSENSAVNNICENRLDREVIPSERGCQYFYFCINGEPGIAACTNGLLFDPIRLNCFPEETVDCYSTTTTTFTISSKSDTNTESISTTQYSTTTPISTTEYSTTTPISTTQYSTTTPIPTTEFSTTEPISTTQSINPTIEPDSICYNIPNGGLINNPESCDSFFMCFFEIPIKSRCTAPLLFNPSINNCDGPENVDCYDIATTTEEPDICKGIPNGEPFNNPKSCSHFFICINNVRYTGLCPLGFYFDEVRRGCFSPEEVDCMSITTTTEESTVSNTKEPSSNACDGIPDWEFVDNPSSCDAFYFCINGQANEGTCSPPLLFNPINRLCDLPENVYCPPETTTEYVDICFGSPNFIFINDDMKCADYFMCFNDQSISRTCPDTFYFDPQLLVCVPSETVECTDDNGYDTTTSSISTEISSTEEPTTSDKITSSTEEITTGSISTTEEPSTTEKSTTTTEDTTTDDNPTTTEQSTNTIGSTTTTEPIPDSCPSSGILSIPNPLRCSRFSLCLSGTEFELACPADTHFVFTTGSCEPRETANCQIVLPDCSPVTTAQYYLPHPQYCNRYFMCFAGIMSPPFQCNDGLHFDIERNQCSIPELANCEAI